MHVLAPSGPRPIDGLACVQVLDRASLSFMPSAPYDAIEVRRNGAVIAALPGTATGHESVLPGNGLFRYGVVALRDGVASLEVSCELLAVSPAAPPVGDLACGESLTWTNPVTFGRVTVFRDGEPVAELPGDAQVFTDPDRPADLAVYTVVGELEGFRGPDVHCLSNGTGLLEIGDVVAPVDADVIRVPVYATTPGTVRGFECYLDMDLNPRLRGGAGRR